MRSPPTDSIARESRLPWQPRIRPCRSSGSPRAAAKGFTLIEALIAVAIVALLSLQAYPSYARHLQRAARSDAKDALLDFAAREERFYTMNNRYSAVPTELGYAAARFPIDIRSSGRVYYRLAIQSVGNGSADTPPTFAASAAPVGNQANDACGTYQIDELGRAGNSSNTTASANCW